MKISTDSIQGFEAMSPEDKVSALLGIDLPDPVDLSGYVKKADYDAKVKEAAEASKQLKTRMSTEEQAQAESQKAMQDLQERYNELLKSSTIASHTARYLALPGFDEALAHETAEALFEGDMDKVFENQKKAGAAREKELKAALMRQEGETAGAGAGHGGNEENTPDLDFVKRRSQERTEARKQAEAGLSKFIL